MKQLLGKISILTFSLCAWGQSQAFASRAPEAIEYERFDLKLVTDLSKLSLTGRPNLRKQDDIRELNLEHNKLSEIPREQLPVSLNSLCLSNNLLTSFPAVQHLTNLICLELNNNRISTIPDLRPLVNLQILDVNYNQIIDQETLRLPSSLRFLGLRSNELRAFPNITNVENLKCIDLSNNEITALTDLSQFKTLEKLYIVSNPVAEDYPHMRQILRHSKILRGMLLYVNNYHFISKSDKPLDTE